MNNKDIHEMYCAMFNEGIIPIWFDTLENRASFFELAHMGIDAKLEFYNYYINRKHMDVYENIQNNQYINKLPYPSKPTTKDIDEAMGKSINLIKEQASYQINQCESKIAELTEKINGSFLYQFSWRIETLYKAHYLKREWTGILEAYNNHKEQEMLAHHKRYFVKQALSDSKLSCSTNPASNISQLWEHECDIEIAKFFIEL